MIYQAELTPTKAELLAAWVPSQPWSGGAAATPLELVGAYRFDDPAGEVGIETHLLRTAHGQLLQVPLTYRGAPLEGAEDHLAATMQHSHLGPRWIYDGCVDPVYATALATAIRTGGREAELWVETDGGRVRREPTMRVAGSGAPGSEVPAIDTVTATSTATTTAVESAGLEIVVLRVVGATADVGDAGTLTGTWPGNDEPALLALARRSPRPGRNPSRMIRAGA